MCLNRRQRKQLLALLTSQQRGFIICLHINTCRLYTYAFHPQSAQPQRHSIYYIKRKVCTRATHARTFRALEHPGDIAIVYICNPRSLACARAKCSHDIALDDNVRACSRCSHAWRTLNFGKPFNNHLSNVVRAIVYVIRDIYGITAGRVRVPFADVCGRVWTCGHTATQFHGNQIRNESILLSSSTALYLTCTIA